MQNEKAQEEKDTRLESKIVQSKMKKKKKKKSYDFNKATEIEATEWVIMI